MAVKHKVAFYASVAILFVFILTQTAQWPCVCCLLLSVLFPDEYNSSFLGLTAGTLIGVVAAKPK